MVQKVRGPYTRVLMLALTLAVADGCASKEPPEASGPPPRPALGTLMMGPRALEDTPIQVVWAYTFGVVTSPIWLPWYGAIFARQGKAAANEQVYGPRPAGTQFASAPPHVSALLERPGIPGSPDAVAAHQLPPGVPQIEFGSYRALIIGIDDYAGFDPLETPVNDAWAVARVLSESYGFETIVLENATRADIMDALMDLRHTLVSNDNLLLYFAGHGVVDEETGAGYWLPTDARPASQALQKIARKQARLVLTSGGLEPVADAGDGTNSVFAINFLEILRENRGVLEGNELFSQVRRSVMEDAHQTPEYGPIRAIGHDGGDFLFVRRR